MAAAVFYAAAGALFTCIGSLLTGIASNTIPIIGGRRLRMASTEVRHAIGRGEQSRH